MALYSLTEGVLISFTTPDKIILHGFLTKPDKAKTCIIYVHGMTGNFYSHALIEMLRSATNSEGHAFFSINTRGHGGISRISTLKGGKKTIGTNIEKFRQCVYDISGALHVLRKLGFDRFILAGHSTGCQKIAYYQYKTKDRSVKALILLAPADDYNIQKRDLGRRFLKIVRLAKSFVRKNKPDECLPECEGFSAQRFLSIADARRVESRMFNYDGALKEFSAISIPVYASFGSKEQYAAKPIKQLLDILKNKTNSIMFSSAIINNADHSFKNHERKVASSAMAFLKRII